MVYNYEENVLLEKAYYYVKCSERRGSASMLDIVTLTYFLFIKIQRQKKS
jgi:hypothetical protein